MQQGLLLLAVVTLLGSLTVVAGDAFLVATPRAAFAPRASVVPLSSQAWGLSLRGGATLVTEEDSDEEEESENEEEEEEEEEDEFDASLAAAAVKSTQKAKKKTQSAVKETVSAKLAKPKKKESLLKLLRVPYIIRAFLNPVTILSMTKHYWLSLINLEYPPRVRRVKGNFLCCYCWN